jgi:hypothetical protein
MAIYKIFPTKDATLYSTYPSENTGLDEIIECSTKIESFTEFAGPQTSRFLIQFDSTEINDVITNKVSGSTFQTNLRCFVADMTGLNANTSIDIYPISGTWNMGTGKYDTDPISTDGVSWGWRASSGSNAWIPGTLANYVTASYLAGNVGGGTWYTGSSDLTVLPITASKTFTFYGDKDIDVNVTNIVKAWSASVISNNGFIIKQTNEFVDDLAYQAQMKFFSRDTHTIYPPCLEFRWRDYVFNTGSSTTTILNNLPVTITLNENPGIFYPNSINRFRVNSRPTYPPRNFLTASEYTRNYYLPTASYYAIKDLATNEYVIDFDTQYTQLSADATGSYFTLYMNGLEPERYYKILIQTTINGSTQVIDDNYNFKVVNG